jgi:hypothetical protein
MPCVLLPVVMIKPSEGVSKRRDAACFLQPDLIVPQKGAIT